MGRISHQEEFGCRGERLKTQTPQGSLILLIGSKIDGVYRSVRPTVLLPFVFLGRGMYIC